MSDDSELNAQAPEFFRFVSSNHLSLASEILIGYVLN